MLTENKFLTRSPALYQLLFSRGSSIFVWGVWSLMLLIALACVYRYGRNIPLAEDWLMVAPLTGNEPDLLG